MDTVPIVIPIFNLTLTAHLFTYSGSVDSE